MIASTSDPSKPADVHAPKAERRAQRERSLLAAKVSWGDGAFQADANVTQISATGARLTLPGTPTLPSEFTVIIPRRSMRRQAQVVWRDGDELALRFMKASAGDVSATPGERAQIEDRIRTVAEENAKLKSENARLRTELARVRGG